MCSIPGHGRLCEQELDWTPVSDLFGFESSVVFGHHQAADA
jgi:hypothetical protein